MLYMFIECINISSICDSNSVLAASIYMCCSSAFPVLLPYSLSPVQFSISSCVSLLGSSYKSPVQFEEYRATMNRLCPEFVAEFGELMTKELQMTSNEFFNGGKQILERHKLLKEAKQVLPKYFLIHQDNRNRLMLMAGMSTRRAR